MRMPKSRAKLCHNHPHLRHPYFVAYLDWFAGRGDMDRQNVERV